MMLTQVHVSLVCPGEIGGEGIPGEKSGEKRRVMKSTTFDDLYLLHHQTDR